MGCHGMPWDAMVVSRRIHWQYFRCAFGGLGVELRDQRVGTTQNKNIAKNNFRYLRKDTAETWTPQRQSEPHTQT